MQIGSIKTDYIMKHAEHTFFNTNCRITITDIANRMSSEKVIINIRNKGRGTKHIIVKAEWKPYAECLKNMKKVFIYTHGRMGIQIEMLKR